MTRTRSANIALGALTVAIRPRMLAFLVAALLLVTTVQASALEIRATSRAKVPADSCAPVGNAPAPLLVASSFIRNGMRGSAILYQQRYVWTTLPCRLRLEGAIVDPAYLKGRVAKRDIFPGRQLTSSQFSDPDKREAVGIRGTCPPGTEANAVRLLIAKKLIREGLRGSVIINKRLSMPTVLPCGERWKGAIANPAYLKGRIAKHDIFAGQQLTRSQFSGV